MGEASRTRFLKKRNRRAPPGAGTRTDAAIRPQIGRNPNPMSHFRLLLRRLIPLLRPILSFRERLCPPIREALTFRARSKGPKRSWSFWRTTWTSRRQERPDGWASGPVELAKLGLSVRETNRFYELNEEIQGNLLKESAATGKRLLGIDSIGPAEVDRFFRYSQDVRLKMLGLPDGALANLLNQGVDESLLMGSLSVESIAASQSGKLPAAPPENALNTRAMALAERFKDTSQSYALEELLASGGGVLDEEALRRARWPIFCFGTTVWGRPERRV